MARTLRWWVALPLMVTLVLMGCRSGSPGVEARAEPAFEEICMVTKYHGWAIASGGVFRTLDGGVTWWSVTPPGVEKVSSTSACWFFSDAATAWLVVDREHVAGAAESDGVLLSTIDGGRHWSRSETPFASARLFVNRDDNRTTGWALKRYGPASGSEPVDLYRMESNGAWTLVHRGRWPADPAERRDGLPFGGLKRAIGFLTNGRTGWVTVEYRGQDQLGFYMTMDRGKTWRVPDLPIPPDLEGGIIEALPPRFFDGTAGGRGILPVIFHFIRERNQYGEFAAVFFVTETGGVSWKAASVLRAKGHRPFVSVVDDANWWVLADSLGEAKLHATHDAGATWAGVGSVRQAFQVQFVTPVDGWALSEEDGRSILLRTTDGGNSWFQVPVKIRTGRFKRPD